MAQEPALPLPDLSDPFTAPFWQAARKHKLIMPHCHSCGHIQWPPRNVCSQCLATLAEDAWREVPQTGEIWSFVVYHRAFHPGFADRVPYNVALVRLDAGPLFVTNITGGNDLKIGERVTAQFETAQDEVILVRFRHMAGQKGDNR